MSSITTNAEAGCGRPESGAPLRAPDWPQTDRPRVSSRDLFHGRDVLEIAHGDAVYRLRITSQGKLILTK